MPNLPQIEGQLGWNAKRQQPQYILTWDIDEEQPILSGDVRFAFVNGGIEQAGTVDVRTGATSISNGGSRAFEFNTSTVTVTTPKNVQIKAGTNSVTGGDKLCLALAKGYSGPDPVPGRQVLENYVVTAIRPPTGSAPEPTAPVPEITSLGTDASPAKLTIQYKHEESIANLHVCRWDDEAEKWKPYEEMRENPNEVEISFNELGLYALMTDVNFKRPSVSYRNGQDQAVQDLGESALDSVRAIQAAAKAAEAALRTANNLSENGNGRRTGVYTG